MATKEIRPDLVVFCTGYKVDASWLGEEYPRYRDEKIDVREICSSEDISLSVSLPLARLLAPPVLQYLTIIHVCSTSDSFDQESVRSRRSPNNKRCSGRFSFSTRSPSLLRSLIIDFSSARPLESRTVSIIPPTCRLSLRISDRLLACSSCGGSTELTFWFVTGQSSRLMLPLHADRFCTALELLSCRSID